MPAVEDPIPPHQPRRRPIAISRALGKVVVTVHGELDADRVETLHRVLVDLVDGQGNLDVVVDLRDLDAMHAGVQSALADVATRARLRGGALRLSDARGGVLPETTDRVGAPVA